MLSVPDIYHWDIYGHDTTGRYHYVVVSHSRSMLSVPDIYHWDIYGHDTTGRYHYVVVPHSRSMLSVPDIYHWDIMDSGAQEDAIHARTQTVM